ncbi:MAG: outer membrane lipid asymmetry maintenance protein MlaD [Chromatiales bacterium]|nr:outer membrane lipid asymmetry maintenance protein MlaD [Chromatiales bacterium]
MEVSRSAEIGVGVFVAVGLAALFFLAMQVSNLASFRPEAGYRVTARFDNVGSLKPRAPVTVAGVKVGQVESIDFDKTTFEAVVTMLIAERYNTLPSDSNASIYTAGLLGEQYVGIEPGGANDNLKEGSELRLTQSALVLERLIGQFLFSKTQESSPLPPPPL